MAKTAREPNAALLGEDGGLSAEESGLMEANRESESISPEPEAETQVPEKETPEAEPELDLAQTDDIKPDVDPATGKQRKVDYGAFHSERERRKASDADAAKAKQDLATLTGRFDVLRQLAEQSRQPQQTQQTDEIPDINLDPVGHFQAKFSQAERQLADVNKWRQSQEANATAMNNVQQLGRIAQQSEAEFSKTTPDYPEAFQYVKTQRDRELQDMGYSDPGQREQIMQTDALQIAAQALNSKMSPAEVVYKIAKARGYAGKAPAPAAPVKASEAPDAKKLATVAKGQAANTSLGQVGGTSIPEFSAESIAKMSDSEFEKWATDDNWRKMMGG